MVDQYNVQNTNEQEIELSLEDILFMLKRRFWWGFFTVVLVVAATVAYLLIAIPQYTSTVTIKVNPTSQSSSVSNIFSGGIPGMGASQDISTEIELIKSRTNMEMVIRQLNLVDVLIEEDSEARIKYNSDQLVQIAVNKLVNGDFISVSPVKDTQIVEIAVEIFSPELAKNIASTLAEVYNNQLKE